MVDISLGQEILHILLIDRVIFTEVMDCILEHGKEFPVFKDAIFVRIVLGESGIDCAYDLVFSEVGHSDCFLDGYIYFIMPAACFMYENPIKIQKLFER